MVEQPVALSIITDRYRDIWLVELENSQTIGNGYEQWINKRLYFNTVRFKYSIISTSGFQ